MVHGSWFRRVTCEGARNYTIDSTFDQVGEVGEGEVSHLTRYLRYGCRYI